MAQWHRKYNPSILVQELEKSRSINSEGKAQFDGFGMMTISPKLQEMICMNSEITHEDKHGIVMQSIFNAGRDTLTAETILTEINQLEGAYLSSCEHNYIVVTSLSIDKNHHKLPNVKIDDNKINFSASLPKSFAKAIDNMQSIIYFTNKKKLPSDYLQARVSVRAKSVYLAAEKALDSLNFFRGILNFAINFGGQTFSFGGGYNKPINRILLGPIHTLHKPNGEIAVKDVHWFEQGYQEPLQPYYDISIVNSIAKFDRIMKAVNKIYKNIKKSKRC